MPNRIIKESAFSSDKIASLSDFEFRLWIGLITQADDTGRGDARPAIIKGRVFPLRERVTTKDIDAALHAAAAKGCVTLYTVGGRPYFWFPSWTEHQRIRDCKPKYPGIEDADDGSIFGVAGAHFNISPQFAASCGELPQSAALIQSNPIQSESNPNTNPKDKSGAFERIVSAWNSLPLGKASTISPARKKSMSARINEVGEDGVLCAIEKVRGSDFLNGKNDRGWKCTFDWFLNPTNFAKIADGNYDNNNGGADNGHDSVPGKNEKKWDIPGCVEL